MGAVGGGADAPLRLLAIKHGFGHEVDLQAVRGEGVASYCAKYVSKSAADREELPWVDKATGAVRERGWPLPAVVVVQALVVVDHGCDQGGAGAVGAGAGVERRGKRSRRSR